MTLSTIIMLNLGVATMLVAILAAVMLSPSRLRPHFAARRTWRPVHNV